MVSLTLKTKEQTLGFYPELAEYLSKFKAPLVGLLGNFSTGEMLVVEHATNGLHTVISVPKVDGTLRYDLMTELYSGSKRYDTVANIEFPIGKAVNYETFLIVEGGGRALTLHEQPEMNEKSFRLKFEMNGVDMTVSLNGINIPIDPETGNGKIIASKIEPLLSKVQIGSIYQGLYVTRSSESSVTFAVLVTKRSDETYGDVVEWKTCSEDSSSVGISAWKSGDYYLFNTTPR